jgi:ankyrin repeat protein
VRALLAAGADVNAKASIGTALTIASQQGWPEVVRALLAAGADVNAKAFNGETAMSLAKKGGHSEVVQLLKASHPLPDK